MCVQGKTFRRSCQMLVPLSSPLCFQVLTAPFLKWAPSYACVQHLVPAALKLKFTLFVRKRTCSVTCDAGNQCTRLAVFSCDGEMVTWLTFAHNIQNTQYSPHLFKNKCSSDCHFPVFWGLFNEFWNIYI